MLTQIATKVAADLQDLIATNVIKEVNCRDAQGGTLLAVLTGMLKRPDLAGDPAVLDRNTAIVEVMEVLIAAGADVNQRSTDTKGSTPLMVRALHPTFSSPFLVKSRDDTLLEPMYAMLDRQHAYGTQQAPPRRDAAHYITC